MSKQREKDRTKVDSELFGLLESLLSDVGDETQMAAEMKSAQTEPARPFAEPQPAKLLVEPIVDLFQEVADKTIDQTLNKPQELPLESIETETAAAESVRPKWAEAEFSSLMFQVNGQTLAIPVLELSGVAPCPEIITPMPGQPAWHMGVLEYRGRKMVAVDLTKVLGLRDLADSVARGCYLLAVDDGRYGLRCDSIPEPIKVDPDDVRWSHAADGQGLLAGILSKQMCPLLNIDNVLAQLRRG